MCRESSWPIRALFMVIIFLVFCPVLPPTPTRALWNTFFLSFRLAFLLALFAPNTLFRARSRNWTFMYQEKILRASTWRCFLKQREGTLSAQCALCPPLLLGWALHALGVALSPSPVFGPQTHPLTPGHRPALP